MYLKVVLYFALFIKLVSPQGVINSEFFVVSTTKSPKDENVMYLELERKIEEHNGKTSRVESQITQIIEIIREQKKNYEQQIQSFQSMLKTQENNVAQLTETIQEQKKKYEQQTQSFQSLLKIQEKRFENITSDLLDKYHVTGEGLKRPEQKNIQKLPKDCKEVRENGISTSGIYSIQPKSETITVLCDMDISGGGWTVIQNRFDGSQNFDLEWENYKKGFGSLKSEFWLGLEYIHQLAGEGSNELYIELFDKDRKKGYGYYDSFVIGNEEQNYTLNSTGTYVGDAGNSLHSHRGFQFSTKDRDHDNSDYNCASEYGGGWWFQAGSHSNLNGKYLGDNYERQKGVCSAGLGLNWYLFSGDYFSLQSSKMMVRRLK